MGCRKHGNNRVIEEHDINIGNIKRKNKIEKKKQVENYRRLGHTEDMCGEIIFAFSTLL